jgi:hypothetical protein
MKVVAKIDHALPFCRLEQQATWNCLGVKKSEQLTLNPDEQ